MKLDETGTGSAATAKAEDKTTEEVKTVDQENIDNKGNMENDKARAAGHTADHAIAGGDETATVTGFTSFRSWVNRRIRALPAGAYLSYAGFNQKISELTVDGQLRLEYAGSFTMIPFDERYIPALLEQLLPKE